MIVWCSYCQRFMGERAPYDEAVISHGMCAACAARSQAEIASQIETLQPIVLFMREMWSLGLSGPMNRYRDVLRRARELDIGPTDLLAGLVTPLLAELGRHWEVGSVTVAQEHRFTAFYQALIHDIRFDHAELDALLDAEQPHMLLINGDGNYHTVGLKILELWLAERGVSSRITVPGLPPQGVLDAVERWRPRMLGLSLSMPEQISPTRDTVMRLGQTAPDCTVFVGGYLVKRGWITQADLPGAVLVRQVVDFAPYLPIPAA